MSTLADVIPYLIDLTRDDSPDVIDLTADTPPPSDQRPLSPSPGLDRRATTPLLEVKPEDAIIIPETQNQANNDDLELQAVEPLNIEHAPFDEDAILAHPPPPPGQRFPSRDAIIAYLNNWAWDHGFALVIVRSTPEHHKAYLGCVCHPQKARYLPSDDALLNIPGAALYQPPAKKRKPKRTVKTGCLFKMYIKDRSLQDSNERGRRFREGDPESWSFEICEGFGHHNHPPLPPVAVAFMRRLRPLEKAFVIEEIKRGTAAMDIVRAFRNQYPSRPIQTRDVWNLAYFVRKDERAGFSAAEATLAKMRELGELHDAWLDDHGRLVGLAYTSSKARALTHRHPTGLFFDCTYRTNLYKLPLLHIVGSTATGQTFTSAVVLLLRETTGWYEKAIRSALKILAYPPFEVAFVDREPALHNALRLINPSVHLIYCLWHLKENIKDRYAKDFALQFGNEAAVEEEGDDNDAGDNDDDILDDHTPRPLWRKKLGRFLLAWETYVVRAKTLEAMQDGVKALRFEYQRFEKLGRALKYVTIDLLEKKEHFVHAFTDIAQHFGQRSSSSIEGRHYKLKRNIKRSRADVFYLFEVIRRYLDDEWDRINHRSAEERTILARDLGSLFSQLNGRVSRRCIALLKGQVEAYKKEKKAELESVEKGMAFVRTKCLGSTRTAYGIPCSHDLAPLIRGHLPIPLDKINRHWHLTSAAKMEEVRGTLDSMNQREGMEAGQYERINPDGWSDVTPRVSNPPPRRTNQAENQRHRARLQGGPGTGSSQRGESSQAGRFVTQQPPSTDPNTGRILSQGERIDGARVRARTCGHCGRAGHDLRKCPEGADERARRAAIKESRQETQALNAPPSSQHFSTSQYH